MWKHPFKHALLWTFWQRTQRQRLATALFTTFLCSTAAYEGIKDGQEPADNPSKPATLPSTPSYASSDILLWINLVRKWLGRFVRAFIALIQFFTAAYMA